MSRLKPTKLVSPMFCIPYALGWLAVFIASFWLNIDQQIALLSGMALAVGIILSFYFGGGFIEGVLGKAKIDKPICRL